MVIWKKEAEHTEGIADILRSYTRKGFRTGSTEWTGSEWMESTAKAILDVVAGCVNLGNVSENHHGKTKGRLQSVFRISQTMRKADSKVLERKEVSKEEGAEKQIQTEVSDSLVKI